LRGADLEQDRGGAAAGHLEDHFLEGGGVLGIEALGEHQPVGRCGLRVSERGELGREGAEDLGQASADVHLGRAVCEHRADIGGAVDHGHQRIAVRAVEALGQERLFRVDPLALEVRDRQQVAGRGDRVDPGGALAGELVGVEVLAGAAHQRGAEQQRSPAHGAQHRPRLRLHARAQHGRSPAEVDVREQQPALELLVGPGDLHLHRLAHGAGERHPEHVCPRPGLEVPERRGKEEEDRHRS
jgi:hypothetical protein